MAELKNMEEIACRAVREAFVTYQYQGRTLAQWVKVIKSSLWKDADSPPKPGKEVLVYMERDAWGSDGKRKRVQDIEKGWQIDGHWHVDGCSGVDVIAWMPLPLPPKKTPDGKAGG